MYKVEKLYKQVYVNLRVSKEADIVKMNNT